MIEEDHRRFGVGRVMAWDIHNLFKHHAQGIARSLTRRGWTADAAADITQDTFLRVLAAPPVEGGATHNPKAYLYQISRNISTDLHRREMLGRFVDLDANELAAIADPTPSAEMAVYHRQKLRLVERALAQLPERTRHAFELHRLGDQTIAAIGKELGLSTTRTWALIREAYQHILLSMDEI